MCNNCNENIYEQFQPKQKCGCGKRSCTYKKQSCGCPIKLPTECIRYTGAETELLKKNKHLDNILQELETSANKQQFLLGAGVKATETPMGTILSIDEEWLKEFIENL